MLSAIFNKTKSEIGPNGQFIIYEFLVQFIITLSRIYFRSIVMGLPLLLLFVVSCFLAGDANGKLTFICTYLNVKQFH